MGEQRDAEFTAFVVEHGEDLAQTTLATAYGAWPKVRRPGAGKGPPAHPPEPAYPCCLPALGRFTG